MLPWLPSKERKMVQRKNNRKGINRSNRMYMCLKIGIFYTQRAFFLKLLTNFLEAASHYILCATGLIIYDYIIKRLSFYSSTAGTGNIKLKYIPLLRKAYYMHALYEDCNQNVKCMFDLDKRSM